METIITILLILFVVTYFISLKKKHPKQQTITEYLEVKLPATPTDIDTALDILLENKLITHQEYRKIQSKKTPH